MFSNGFYIKLATLWGNVLNRTLHFSPLFFILFILDLVAKTNIIILVENQSNSSPLLRATWLISCWRICKLIENALWWINEEKKTACEPDYYYCCSATKLFKRLLMSKQIYFRIKIFLCGKVSDSLHFQNGKLPLKTITETICIFGFFGFQCRCLKSEDK